MRMLLKILIISSTKQAKFVKQKAVCGAGIRYCSGCLKNAIMSLLHNGEHTFLKSCKYSCFFTYIVVKARSNRWNCPLPCLAAGLVAIGHPIHLVNSPHVTVIIHHNCRLYCIPVFITIIAFSGWIVNVYQEAHVSVVLPHHSCHVTPCPYSNVTTFQSQCHGFEVHGHALFV